MSEPRTEDLVATAIVRKCGTIVSLNLIWQGVARKLDTAGAEPATANRLITAFGSPRHLEALTGLLVSHGSNVNDFERSLRELVDQSSFDYDSWVRAFELLQGHLQQSSRTASPSSMLGYIQCCSDFGGSNEGNESLVELTTEMLEQYGFEGQEGCVIDNR